MENLEKIHLSVMLTETLAALEPKEGGRYLDGTLGLGGHARAILEAAPGSQICGLDRDAAALALARQRLEPFGNRVHFFHLSFADFGEALAELKWIKLNGALLDLGVSSLQLDTPERGFSFREAGPLDMRMDQDGLGADAAKFVNRASFAELRECLATLGEEPQAGRIARRIVDARQKDPITDTAQLAEIVRLAYPPAWRRSARRHPATRAFQALRMHVNDELGQLKIFLELIWDYLAPGARLVIISFHSLEDRLVKQAFRARSGAMIRLLHKKPLIPGAEEGALNPRASSAKLRAAEMLGGAA